MPGFIGRQAELHEGSESADILMDVNYNLIDQPPLWSLRKGHPLRKSKLEAAQTREAIVTAAADLIRRVGIGEASLADMMAAAGLTHGGFYRHFRNKEHLVSEALAAAGEMAVATLGRQVARGGLSVAIDGYLSTSHRDSRTPTCPFAALGSEIARCGHQTKAAMTEILEKLLVTLAGKAADHEKARGDAIVALSTMIGAMTLARVVTDRNLSSEILDRAKNHLRG
jgi:TetR/AcrR family transcriptional repressor of nem operon